MYDFLVGTALGTAIGVVIVFVMAVLRARSASIAAAQMPDAARPGAKVPLATTSDAAAPTGYIGWHDAKPADDPSPLPVYYKDKP